MEGQGATLVDALVAAVVPATDEEDLKEDEEMALWCKHQCPF